jgi:hypothetical protein
MTKVVPTKVRWQDVEKPKAVIDCNSGMAGVNLSDAYLTSYCNTRKRLKNTVKSTTVIWYNRRETIRQATKSSPPTRMNVPYYSSYIAATVSKLNLCWCCVMCYKKDQCPETRYKCENCRVTLYAAPFPTLPYGSWLLEVWKGIEVQHMAKKCLKVRFL